MNAPIQDIIRKRKSVRTYNGDALRPEDRKQLENFVQTAKNPFDILVEFRFLDAQKYELTSPVISGTNTYVAAKVKRVSQFGIACGYSFESFCLFAKSLGIGTVMLAGTLSRNAFEAAMDVSDTEVMPVASPVGYPADKMSVRERIMRKGVQADTRLPFETLFFERSFEKALTPNRAGRFKEALEMVRLAPSAVNKQPWRVVVCDDTVHFYEKKAKALQNNPLGDIQKVDIGIALSHFDLTLKESGASGNFIANDPELTTDELTEYIVSYELNA